jgi:hypothetical protein
LPPAYYGESLEPNIQAMDEQLRKIAIENHALYYSAWDRLCNANGCLNRIPNTDNALTTLDEDHITPAAARYIVQGLSADILKQVNSTR